MPKTSRPTDAAPVTDPVDVTPLDGDDFLAANRANRERHREEAERKAEKAARTPGKVSAEPRRRRLPSIRPVTAALVALSILVVGLAISTAYFAYAYVQADDRAAAAGPAQSDRQEAMDTARRYAAALATYDPANYADLDRRIREISTPEFAKTYITSSADARRGNATARGTSKAESKDAGLQSISDSTATVLVTLDQTVTSPDVKAQVPEGIPYQSRVKVTLQRVDGKWLLSDLDTV
ncbi:hypothetical protein AAFP30_03060 [Gordonia sp. CPCC 205515]|uniref:hypothetical protein n=1 Tax=Gordonia sp. CPCC 205515 TaxID=3140791 RepID=UPI003AF3F385